MFKEGIFNKSKVQVSEQVEVQVELIETDIKILIFLYKNQNVKRIVIISYLGYNVITRNVRNSINKLVKEGLIELTIPHKPNNPNQKHKITKKEQDYINTRK